ncbi:hypothetical protein F4809DRAFT_650767 [Biscogniauxia mediterranea]|nr:hypothetical protein F4809DRAFT_650767 [Biscogniauxia mediterranea]
MPHSLSPARPSPSPPTAAAEDTMADVTMTEATNEAETKDVKLEDLFDDVDSDDEFSGSKPAQNKPSSPAAAAPTSPIDIETGFKASDPEIMRMFYQRLFPWRYLFQWLNHSPTPTNDFSHREFALTLPGDIYSRYNSYPSADLLRKDILLKMPSRFEIGPVYTTNPRDRKTMRNQSAFKPLSKELCFDIDLTDYDDIRTCCDKANICGRCWQFMTMAIKVVDAALREDFGFRHIMWVYSGRRGAHAWVCDKKARAMDDQKRRAIAGYLEVIRGGAQSGKKVNIRRPLHPHLSRSLELLAPHFQQDVLESQDPWSTPERAEHLLSLLPDRSLNEGLRRKWDSCPGRGSAAKWADIDAVAKAGASGHLDTRALLEAKQDVVLEYTYPRLDIEVSKKLNHLLKSPFVVHPGTGRVCVPIDASSPGSIEAFDPLAVPTVQGLLAEIDAWDGGGGGVKKEQEEEEEEGGKNWKGEGEAGRAKSLQDWEKTSLRPYIEFFRAFVLALMRDERDPRVKREREEEGGGGGGGMEF